MDKATPTPSPASVDKQAALVAKLRYMGKQYAAGQVARGGSPQKHYLEEAAEEIEMMAWALSMNTKTPASAQENADLRNVIQAACIDGLPGLSRAWEKYFPDHPITIKGEEVERLAAQAAPTGLTDMGWVIDAATKGELAAYDQGSAECQQAVTKILDGKDTGAGTANPPWEPLRRRLIALVAQAPVVQAGDMRSYLDFVLEPRHINGEVSAVEYEQALIELRLLRDRASSGAAQAAPRCVTCDGTGEVHRADGTWVGTCFCAEGKRAATTQAVRMLTDEEKVKAWNHDCNALLSYADAVIRAFCAVNANRTIPADGKIGGAA